MFKYCPYCAQRLGFISLVKQRLFAKEDTALVCDKCGSSISSSGSARVSLLIGGGGMCGYFWGKIFGEFVPFEWLVILSSVIVAGAAIVLLAYWSAPIKSG
jgi:hypothetical protein